MLHVSKGYLNFSEELLQYGSHLFRYNHCIGVSFEQFFVLKIYNTKQIEIITYSRSSNLKCIFEYLSHMILSKSR